MITDFVNVVVGHDAVHPDRSDCGGVGACVLMRTEYDVREQLTDAVERMARRGLVVTAALSASTTMDD